MNNRAAIGFLIAPLVVASVVDALTPPEQVSFKANLGNYIVTGFAWYLGALAFSAIIAIPAFELLNRYKLVRWWSAVAVGSFIGFLAKMTIGELTAKALNGPMPLSILGGVSALVFWYVWKSSSRVVDPDASR